MSCSFVTKRRPYSRPRFLFPSPVRLHLISKTLLFELGFWRLRAVGALGDGEMNWQAWEAFESATVSF